MKKILITLVLMVLSAQIVFGATINQVVVNNDPYNGVTVNVQYDSVDGSVHVFVPETGDYLVSYSDKTAHMIMPDSDIGQLARIVVYDENGRDVKYRWIE